MNIEEQKKLRTMQRASRSQLRDREGLWEVERSGDRQQAKQCWQRRLWELERSGLFGVFIQKYVNGSSFFKIRSNDLDRAHSSSLCVG